MTIKKVFIAIAALTVAVSTAAAQERRYVPAFETFGEAASPTDAIALKATIEELRTAWATQDIDRYMAIHAEDTEWINAFARIFRGKEALGDFLGNRVFQGIDPAIAKQEMENLTWISLRYVGDDVAIAHLYTDGERGMSRNEGEVQRRTHLHFVIEKQEGDWLIVHTAIMDAR